MKTTTKLGIGIAILACLSPLGIWLTDIFKAGDAWGEWDPETIRHFIGYLPQGLQRMSEMWKAPLPDYAFRGWEGKPLAALSWAYIFAAGLGIVLVIGVMIGLGRWLARRDN